MIELTNNITHEFIGLTAEIVESTNKQIIGQRGIVMNETRNMFLLKTKFGLKQIPKDCNIWKFFANNDQIIINGNLLIKRPHDRLEIKA